jgi:hypothetical protein
MTSDDSLSLILHRLDEIDAQKRIFVMAITSFR